METPSRHSFDCDGSTRVFPIPSHIKGDNFIRVDVDGVIINDHSKYDIVNNAIVFIDAADVPAGVVLDVFVVQSAEAIGQLGATNSIDIVAEAIGNVNTVGTNIADVNTVVDNMADINTVEDNMADVNTVAENIADVNTVVDNMADVNTVADNMADINTVEDSIANVNTVAGIDGDVTTVAGISSDITTVANGINSSSYNNTDWDTAYSWGDHSTEGYITSLADDTSPELGGHLRSNGHNIELDDNNHIRLWENGYSQNGRFSRLAPDKLVIGQKSGSLFPTSSWTTFDGLTFEHEASLLGSNGVYFQLDSNNADVRFYGEDSEETRVVRLEWQGDTEQLEFSDGVKAVFGDDGDFVIYHDSAMSHTYFKETGQGSLIVEAQDLIINNTDATQHMIYASAGGAVSLYHAGDLRVQTNDTGVGITGDISISGSITASGYNSSNWDTAHGWGDHSTEGYLVASDITGKVNKSGDTMTGNLLFNNDIQSSYNDVLKVYASGSKGYIITPAGTESNADSDDLRVATGSSAWGDGGDLELAAGLTLDSESSGGSIRLNAGNYYQQGGSDYSWGAHITMGGASATRTGSISIYAGEADEGTNAVDAGDVNISAGRAIGENEGGRINFNVYNSTGKVIGEGGVPTPAGYFYQTGELNLRQGLSVTGLIKDRTDTSYYLDLDNTGTSINVAGSITASGYNNTNWDTAYGWGDHSTAGYLTSESNDLSSSVTWANVPDANITESSVTQHQAALSITESQISDLQSYLTSFDVVDDTSPELGGDLNTNAFQINVGNTTGSKLAITNDGSNSTLASGGTTNLILNAGNYINLEADGQTAATLQGDDDSTFYHTGTARLTIQNTGIDVNGDVGGDSLSISGNGTVGGNLTVTGNLQVDGTTTTVNSTTLDVADLNITVAKGAANADAANGAGLTVDGASATITYNSTDDDWEFNKGLDVAGDIVVSGTVDGVDIQTLNTTAGSALQNLVEDTTPQLGGTLSMNNHGIYGYGTIEAWGSTTAQDEVVTSISMIDKANGSGDTGKIVFEAMGRPDSTFNEEYPDLYIKQYVSGTTDALRPRMKFMGSAGYIYLYDADGNPTFTYDNTGRIETTQQLTTHSGFYSDQEGDNTTNVGYLTAVNNQVYVGNITGGHPISFRVGNLEKARLSSTAFNAPNLYDADDTAYYLDPANTNTALKLAGNIELDNDKRIRVWENGYNVNGPVSSLTASHLVMGYKSGSLFPTSSYLLFNGSSFEHEGAIWSDGKYFELDHSNADVRFFGEDANGARVVRLEWQGDTEQLEFADNVKAVFGDDDDLQIFHYNNQNFINSANNMGLYFYNDLVSFNSQDGTYETLVLDNANNTIYANTNIDVTGNIAVSGTVDGRDVATDGTKLDGIEAGATADQTKADIDALGIDAATLDGYDTTSSGNRWGVIPTVATDGVMEVGRYIDFHNSDADTSDFAVRLDTGGGTSGLLLNGFDIWHSGNDGSGSGLDADLLDGSQGSYYNHRLYTDADTYLGGYYVSGGTEKPNNTIFGAGKLKIAMLGSSNLGFGGSWNDVLWMSTYTGGDVKGSWAIVGDKYSDNMYIARQNYDASSWGTGHKLWHTGNDGSGSGLDADTVDGIQAGSFLRSDTADYAYGSIVISTGTSQPLALVTSNSSPWALTISRSDLGNGADCRFFNAGGYTYTDKRFDSGTDIRAPRFYDRNDTAYYVDPASTTVLNALTVGGSSVWTSGNDGSGSGLDADLLDGLDLHTGRNNEANKVVRTDENGYIQAGWINTTSGNATTNTPDKFYGSYDGYVRYYDRAYTQMYLGNTYKYTTSRKDHTSDSNYWVGSMGWGNNDLNDVIEWGSGFWDSWSTPSNSPSGTSHWTGLNALHYSNGTNTYGFQLTVGAGSPGLMYVRGQWGSSPTSWYKVWNEANDGSGSGLDADLWDGNQFASYLDQPLLTTSTAKFANLQLSSATPTIYFNGTGDGGDGASSDMAIKATPEGLDFYEPEDSSKIHFRIYDDTGVDAPFGYHINGTRILDSNRSMSNVTYGGNAIFHDGYHPNADKWTTSRTNTVTLTGDVTGSGSATVDGTGNWTVSIDTSRPKPIKSTSDYVSGSLNESYALLASVTLSGSNLDAYAEFHVVMAGRGTSVIEMYKVVVRADNSSSYRQIYVEPISHNRPHASFDPSDFILAWDSYDHYVYIKSNDGWQIPYVFPLVHTSTDEQYVEGDWVFPSDGSWLSSLSHSGSLTGVLMDKLLGSVEATSLKATTDVQAPIFRDSSDTSKYIDLVEYDGWRLKSSIIANYNTTLDFSWVAGTVKQLKIVFTDVRPAADGAYLALQFGNGTTFSSTGYYYKISPTYTSGDYYYSNQTYARLHATGQGASTDEAINGEIVIYPGNGQGKKHTMLSSIGVSNTSANGSHHLTQAHHLVNYTTSNPMNAVRLFFSSGSIYTGKIQFYEMED